MRSGLDRSLGVIYCASHGILLLFLLVGIFTAGGSDRALHSPATETLTEYFISLLSGVDWSSGLHCRGSDPGRRAAAWLVSSVSATAKDS